MVISSMFYTRDGFRETKPRFGVPFFWFIRSWKFGQYYSEKRAGHPRCSWLREQGFLVGINISTRGLDSSTTLEYFQALSTAMDITRMTAIVSLYQAGENL
ncbi:hypothetical protein K435DRAFT_188533 [Dendrothele bispora CBS 962.96]|uniref:Uncharacterized protein n=1 Tax=Dendrothele bispora (strain CBS 962.96) TaxID=1314807 RepID=A0A4S8LW83_DENBC|nr:hypothetical protein K435DRAFT_188533 [Dendrothele bispora CBS 962.96]